MVQQQLQLRLLQQLSAVRAEARAIQLQLDTEHRGSGGRARAALAHGTSAGRLGPFEVASVPAPFEFFGIDVADDGALARAARAVAHLGEIIVVCGDGSAYASPTALNTVRVCESWRVQATGDALRSERCSRRTWLQLASSECSIVTGSCYGDARPHSA